MPAKKTTKITTGVEIEVDTYASRAEKQFVPSVTLSLLESCRSTLPQGNEPSQLVQIAVKMPGLYATFLGKLVSGCSVRAACLGVGLPPNKVWQWLQEGSADVADDNDTYCGRFLLDVQRSAAMSVGDAEERVFQESPDKWLSRSPTGKQFHKDQYWGEQKQIPGYDTPEEDNPLEPAPARPALEDATVSEDSGEDNLSDALKILEDHNIVTDPEFIKQAKAQFRLEGPPKD